MMIEFLKKSFLQPLTCNERLKVYLFSVPALIGISFIGLYVAFDLAGQGFADIAGYAVTRALAGNMILMPLLAWIVNRFRTKNFIWLVGFLQALALVGLALLDDSTPGWLIGIYLALLDMPFWFGYHLMMVLYTSDDNRGNEVAIGTNIFDGAVIAGSLAGGVALTFFPSTIFLFIGGLFIFIATFYYTWHISRKICLQSAMSVFENPRGFWQELFYDRRRVAISLASAFGHKFSSFFIPVWIKIMGLSGMMAGTVAALLIFLKITLSPIAGHWVNQNKANEIRTGGALIGLGWVPWFFASHPALFTISGVFWASGQHLYGVGEPSRWYAGRSINAIAAREMVLGFARIFASVIGALILFHMPEFFALTGFLAAGIMVAAGLHKKTKDKTSEGSMS